MTEAMINLTFEDCKKSCVDTGSFTTLKDQAILVTGGTGFMGKWIAEMVSFLNETEGLGIKLYLLARDIQKFRDEVPHLAGKSFINLLAQDVKNIHGLPEDINYIIHAAGSPDNREHVSQPLRTVDNFYKGTQGILDAANRLPGLKKVIHISSHQVYGQNTEGAPMSESFSGNQELNNINNNYADAKRIAETLCRIYRSQMKVPVLIMRPFAFIGPYHDLEKPWAINNFIRDGILGGPIRILGNGSTVRSYLYASDMAYWILKTLVSGKVGETYNLGSKQPISLDRLAVLIRDAINHNIEILSKSSKETYSKKSELVPDTAKISREIGVIETTDITDSINRTIVWNQLKRQ
jgi:nucleoside-diphosphate-sugar epimerase